MGAHAFVRTSKASLKKVKVVLGPCGRIKIAEADGFLIRSKHSLACKRMMSDIQAIEQANQTVVLGGVFDERQVG